MPFILDSDKGGHKKKPKNNFMQMQEYKYAQSRKRSKWILDLVKYYLANNEAKQIS